MERRSFLKKAGVTAGAGLLAACSGKGVTAAAGGSNEKVEWTLASSFPKSVDAIFGSAEKFAARVKELTGGNFTIHVKAAGEVVPPLEVLGRYKTKPCKSVNPPPTTTLAKTPHLPLTPPFRSA